MNDKNNKQEERKIMNCISKVICSTYKYIRQLCGLNNDESVKLVEATQTTKKPTKKVTRKK